MDYLAEAVPQLYNIQSGLYKHKSIFIPPIPNSIDEIDIKDSFATCEDGTRFLVQLSSELITFCSDIGLIVLSKSKRW